MMAPMSGTLPMTQVGARATVRGVIAASILRGSMRSDSSTSQKTGTPSGSDHRRRGGHEADRRTDDLRSRADAGGHEGGVQRGRARADANGVSHAECFPRRPLEPLHAGLGKLRVVVGQEGAGCHAFGDDGPADRLERARRIAEALGQGHEFPSADLGLALSLNPAHRLHPTLERERLLHPLLAHVCAPHRAGLSAGRDCGIAVRRAKPASLVHGRDVVQVS